VSSILIDMFLFVNIRLSVSFLCTDKIKRLESVLKTGAMTLDIDKGSIVNNGISFML